MPDVEEVEHYRLLCRIGFGLILLDGVDLCNMFWLLGGVVGRVVRYNWSQLFVELVVDVDYLRPYLFNHGQR